MKTLKGKEGYCYADVEWGMTREETEKAAGVELTEYGVPTLLKMDREISLYEVYGAGHQTLFKWQYCKSNLILRRKPDGIGLTFKQWTTTL